MLVSIILVTYNGLPFTRRCVESVLKYTVDIPFELIFVDNASSDGTPDFLRTLPQTQVVVNAENRGFAAACNQGLHLAQGNYLVLLNNDTVVTEGWLQKLLAHVQRHPNVGAVGPRSNQTGELQYDPEAEGQYADLEEMQDYARRVAARYRGKSLEFHRLGGFCILLKREVIERVGHLDERFGIGFYEDDDYCKRISKAGYGLLIAQDVFIYHEGGASFSGLTSGWANRLMLMNRQRYLAKWADASWFAEMPRLDLAQPAVSVIIATRDRPGLLKEAVASVLAQTFENFELLVVDDGEEDMGPLLDEFADDRIRYFRSPRKGKPSALNAALIVAKGEYIAYLDDDDLYYPWHLQTLVCALTNRPTYGLAYTDMVVGYCLPSDNGHRVVTSHPFVKWEYDRSLLRAGNYIPNLAIMHRRALVDQAGPYDERLPLLEDWDKLRWVSCFTDFLHVPMITGEFHRHLAMTTRNEPTPENRQLKEQTEHYIRSKPLPDPTPPTVYDLVSAAKAAEINRPLQEAANYYLSALRLDPLAFEAGLGAARVLGALGWRTRVKAILRQTIASRPDMAEAYIAYAKELLRKRPPKEQVLEAKEALEIALLVDPAERRGTVYRLLAQCYRRLGQRNTARACRDYSQRSEPLGLIGRFLRLWHREGLVVAIRRALRLLFAGMR